VTEKQNTDTFKTNDKEETKEDNPLTGNIPIEDNDILYEEDDDTSVITMYLTVRQGNAEENTNHTWQQLNGHSNYYYDENGIDRYQVEGILQIGDENGPKEGELGYGLKIPNSIVSIRGQSSSRGVVKSYKIKIKDGKGSWREQQTINLNKHLFDGVRFRNKLCYDLMEELPGMISLRTQFVHLLFQEAPQMLFRHNQHHFLI
jgi:spore coat protein H